jgi:hypothetical protein
MIGSATANICALHDAGPNYLVMELEGFDASARR